MSDPISTMLLKEHQIQFVNAKVNAGYLSSEYLDLLTFQKERNMYFANFGTMY